MKLVRHLFLSVFVLLAFAVPASAQYIWMDSNGDGVHSTADTMNPNGSPTTVDVYLNTSHNKDGSLAECNTQDGDLAVWNSFATHINVSGGTATFTGYTNRVTAFAAGCASGTLAFVTNNSTEMGQCQATSSPTNNGGLNIRLYTVTVTGQTGTPSLSFVQANSQDQNITSFGTACSGPGFDNTYYFQQDWSDNDGLAAAPGGNASPMLNAPATATGTENQPLTITATATDADAGDNLTISATGQPASLALSTTTGPSPRTATLSGTLGFGDQGPYSIVWSVTDGTNPPVTATTALTVNNVDRAPTVSAPATAAGNENTLITFTASASDPDGEGILSFTGSPLPSGASFTVNASKTSGTFSWTPSFTQAGSYGVTFTAQNALSGSATTNITVNNVDRAPTVDAPPTASGASNSLITFNVTAADPDGDAITALTGSPLPAGATFTANASKTSGTFSWTPTNAQTGTFNVTFTAANALSGTGTTQITVTSGDRAPVVTAPATAAGNENTLITFTVSAADPDGDAISSLTGAPLPSGAAFTANASNTSGTFSWTPDFTQAGSYSVTFTATNALGGNATTAITVNNVDRAPVVTAPATASVAENALLTVNVTAADPDGDAITNLTATGTAITAGATFAKNGSNTSGTLTWTPNFTQAGSYAATFTASNALSGSATTNITVTNTDRAPVVTAPASASGPVGTLITFTVSASDPDGDAITSLTAAPLPGAATFTANASKTAGTFNWTPVLADQGTHNVTFTAANALNGSATTEVTVLPPGDAPPAVTAPSTASGAENTNLNFTVSANDPDGDAITSLTAAGSAITAGATFTANASNTGGTFDWTPSFTQAGSYSVTFTAANALTGSATTAITVTNVDRAPVVTAPATASGDEGTLITFTVTASDPDGDAITSLAGAPLPSGATFTANASNTSGTFSWTPSATQSGSYTVTFTAMNALSGSASTEITVNNADVAPVVTAPASRSVAEETNLNFLVLASDPDGEPITSLTAAGSAITAGATFTANASNTSGTFDWTPGPGTAGAYAVTFTAANALSGSATTAIQVTGVNHDPVVTAPASVAGDEGTLITFTVSATDQDGDHVTLTPQGTPSGASFVDNGDNTGTFSWTPSFTSSGVFNVTFQGSDGNGGTGSATTVITVNNVNRTPVADAGGPYTGTINVPVSFDGTGSSDPDGDTLTYSWDFGDGTTGSGATPSHTYTASASYTVTLTVSDGNLTATDATTAAISDKLLANAFTVGGNKTTSLGAGKPYTCVQLEADGGSFQNADVNLASIKMVYPVGSSSFILADASKTAIDGDKNGNGVAEITACFTKADLRTLFAGLPAGRNTVAVTVEGTLVSGATFQATLTMVVKSTGSLAASISPNPLNPQAKLSFATTKPGAMRVQLFDARGRLVKTIADESMARAGYHDFTIDGRTSTGSAMASGVYYVKIWSQFDGNETKAVTILK